MNYLAISFYEFSPLKDLEKKRKELEKILRSFSVKGRIYLSEEGINAQLTIEESFFKEFLSWKESSDYKNAELKVQKTFEHAFARLSVKIREQLCAFDEKVDFNSSGPKLSPKEWKKLLEKKEKNIHVIDVRNQYESKVGHFEGAILPDLETFREFPDYTKSLEKTIDKENDVVMMYCTGGIRCEYYSSHLRKKGFKKVYQLKGGVIAYANEVGVDHWKGKLFVFDDRLTVSLGEDKTISFCSYCNEKSDTYYNCANMDCNKLFICCPDCAKTHQGLCSKECECGRVRAFDSSDHPKPFRRLSES